MCCPVNASLRNVPIKPWLPESRSRSIVPLFSITWHSIPPRIGYTLSEMIRHKPSPRLPSNNCCNATTVSRNWVCFADDCRSHTPSTRRMWSAFSPRCLVEANFPRSSARKRSVLSPRCTVEAKYSRSNGSFVRSGEAATGASNWVCSAKRTRSRHTGFARLFGYHRQAAASMPLRRNPVRFAKPPFRRLPWSMDIRA